MGDEEGEMAHLSKPPKLQRADGECRNTRLDKVQRIGNGELLSSLLSSKLCDPLPGSGSIPEERVEGSECGEPSSRPL